MSQASPPFGGWESYAGSDLVVLTIVLGAIALMLAVAGVQLKRPIPVPQTGDVAGIFLIVIWLLSIATFAVAVFAYGWQMKQMGLTAGVRPAAVRVGTFISAPIAFLIILFLTREHGWRAALASAFFGMCAAPMFFELPFDLIVMAHTSPPVPPHPAAYRALFFLPLFTVQIATFSLLTLLPTVKITRWALFALAGMFAVFTVWATASGFAFPNAPLPLACNIAAKILGVAAGVLLFVGREPA
jgi:hypothetical protein